MKRTHGLRGRAGAFYPGRGFSAPLYVPRGMSTHLHRDTVPIETALPIYSKNIEFLQRHSSHALGPARPALRPSGPFRVCAVDRFERLASPQTQKCRRAAQLAMNTASWRAPARTTCDDSACRMGVACKLAGDGAPLPRRKRPYCNARKGNELPPPEERPEYRQVARAAVGLKSSLRKVCGLRCGFATSRMPSQQSRPIPPRVEHAGEGWRPFAGPRRRLCTSGVQCLQDCLTCCTHWSCSVPKSMR